MTCHRIVRHAIAGLVVVALGASSAVADDCFNKTTCNKSSKPSASSSPCGPGQVCGKIRSSNSSGLNNVPKDSLASPASAGAMQRAPSVAPPAVSAPATQQRVQ